ncbi:hypothetical protein WJX84_007440, partial [Apatococcus fuscideae]
AAAAAAAATDLELSELTAITPLDGRYGSRVEGSQGHISQRGGADHHHDVKAIEYVLKNRFRNHETLSRVLEFTHFACTSEDINNLAHALILQEAAKAHLLPAMDKSR